MTLLGYTTPAAFLAAWARLFAADGGRTGPTVKGDGTVLVVYDLDEADVLAAALLPLITESGEYRKPDGAPLLQERFAKFAVVLAGWTGQPHILIDRVATERNSIPPMRLSITRLE